MDLHRAPDHLGGQGVIQRSPPELPASQFHFLPLSRPPTPQWLSRLSPRVSRMLRYSVAGSRHPPWPSWPTMLR